MKYIRFTTGKKEFVASFSIDFQHKTVACWLDEYWQQLKEEGHITPLHAGFISRTKNNFDTFDYSMGLKLGSTPFCGHLLAKGLASEEGGQFVILPGGQVFLLSHVVFDLDKVKPSGLLVGLGSVTCEQTNTSLEVDERRVTYLPENDGWEYGESHALQLLHLIHCDIKLPSFCRKTEKKRAKK